jgi:hypothetical protein
MHFLFSGSLSLLAALNLDVVLANIYDESLYSFNAIGVDPDIDIFLTEEFDSYELFDIAAVNSLGDDINSNMESTTSLQSSCQGQDIFLVDPLQARDGAQCVTPYVVPELLTDPLRALRQIPYPDPYENPRYDPEDDLEEQISWSPLVYSDGNDWDCPPTQKILVCCEGPLGDSLGGFTVGNYHVFIEGCDHGTCVFVGMYDS